MISHSVTSNLLYSVGKHSSPALPPECLKSTDDAADAPLSDLHRLESLKA